MSDALSKLLTPGFQSTLQLGLDLIATSYSKSATARQAWGQWESETVAAIRKASEIDKQNFRAYQVDLQNWFKQSNYVQKLRQYESQLVKQSAELKTATAISATKNLGRQLADLDAKFYEEEAAATIQLEALRNKSIADAASKVAGGQVGRSIERISNTYHQQWMQNASNRQITTQYRVADKLSAAQAAAIDAENKTNSVALYNPRPYADPVQPLAPIPTETYLPKKPSVSGGLSILDVASAGIKAAQSYMDMRPPELTLDKQKDKPVNQEPAQPNP